MSWMEGNSAGLTWMRPQDGKLFDDLVAEVVNGRCYAFVGAGLSKPAGYPDWAGLLQELANEAHLAPNAFNSEDYLDRAEECFAAMGEARYYAFVERTFSADGREPFRPIHQYLMRTPFKAYLTTNFDGCLEKAAEMIGARGRIHIFPDLNPGDLQQGDIFHIHGKLDHESGMNPVGSIVLTRSDFRLAYEDSSSVHTLLNAAFSYGTVLFVGYSLSDPDLRQIFEAVDRERAALAGAMKRRGVGEMRTNRHFALLPLRLRVVNDGRQESYECDEERERAEERLFQTAGASVMRYRSDDSGHHELTRILESLMQRTQPSPTVPLSTKWDLILPPGASAA